MAHLESSGKIDVQHFIPGFPVKFGESSVDTDSRIVYQDIHAAELITAGIDYPGGLPVLRNVRLQ